MQLWVQRSQQAYKNAQPACSHCSSQRSRRRNMSQPFLSDSSSTAHSASQLRGQQKLQALDASACDAAVVYPQHQDQGNLGLLSISATEAGPLHTPVDFQKMAHAAVRNSNVAALQISGKRTADIPQLLLQLHKAETCLTAVMRPARYCQDYHPDPAWRAAAADAYFTAAAALAQLHGCESFRGLLLHCEHQLLAFVKADAQEGMRTGPDLTTGEHARMPDRDAGHGGREDVLHYGASSAAKPVNLEADAATAEKASNQEEGGTVTTGQEQGGWVPWLRVCRTLLSAWNRGIDRGAANAGHMSKARAYERQCAGALRQLLSDPAAAPRLQLHLEQAKLLEVWTGKQLKEHPGLQSHTPGPTRLQQDLEASQTPQHPTPGPCKQHPQHDQVQPHNKHQQFDGPPHRSRNNVGGTKGIAFSPSGHRQLQLYGDVWLDLAELDTMTEEVAHMVQQRHSPQTCAEDQQPQQQEPVTVVLPLSVTEMLLRHHSSEGVRWQVFTSCIVPQSRLALAILAHLADLRNQIATLQGYPSHAHAALEGSILGTPQAAATFTASFSSALRAYAASDLQDLCRMARRAGLDVHEPSPDATKDNLHGSSSSSNSGIGFEHEGGSGVHKDSGSRVNKGRSSGCAKGCQPGFMRLDPWNIDYLMARAAEQQAAPKTPRSAGSGWHQYQDYFSVGSVLQGLHKILQSSMGLGLVPDSRAINDQDHALVGPWLADPSSSGTSPLHHHNTECSSDNGSLKGSSNKGSMDSSSSSSNGTENSSNVHVARGCVQGEGGVLVRLLVHHESHMGFEEQDGHAQQLSSGSLQDKSNFNAGPVGVVYLHLHTQGKDYPFTTLLQHAQVSTPCPLSSASTSALPRPPVTLVRMALPSLSHCKGSKSALGQETEGAEAQVGGPLGQEGGSPVAWRLPQRVEQPFFLRALCHELGHALHYVLSEMPDATCGSNISASVSSSSSDRRSSSCSVSNGSSVSDSGGARRSREESDGSHDSMHISFPPPPALPRSLRSAQHCPVDWREAGPHILERWATEPAALQQMSRHARLRVPLPPKDATRCSAFLSALSQASVIELTEVAVGALGDQLLHAHLAHAAKELLGAEAKPAAETGELTARNVDLAPAAAASAVGRGMTDDNTSAAPSLARNATGDSALSQQVAGRSQRLQLQARSALRKARFDGRVVLGGGWPAAGHEMHQLPHHQQRGAQQQTQQEEQRPHQQLQSIHTEQQYEGCPVMPQHHHQRVLVAPSPDPLPGLVEPLAVGLDSLALADAQAVVGGAQVAYVLTKLLAAAAWRAHLEQDPLCPRGGRAIRRLLLEVGAHTHLPQQMVTRLLNDPHALVPLYQQRDSPQKRLFADELTNGSSRIDAGGDSGWVPDLGSDAWQDIDLLR